MAIFFLKNNEMKIFPEKQKPRKFITCRPPYKKGWRESFKVLDNNVKAYESIKFAGKINR